MGGIAEKVAFRVSPLNISIWQNEQAFSDCFVGGDVVEGRDENSLEPVLQGKAPPIAHVHKETCAPFSLPLSLSLSPKSPLFFYNILFIRKFLPFMSIISKKNKNTKKFLPRSHHS